MTDQQVIAWVETTCLLWGARRSTALRVAAEFAAAFERGEITTGTRDETTPVGMTQARRGATGQRSTEQATDQENRRE